MALAPTWRGPPPTATCGSSCSSRDGQDPRRGTAWTGRGRGLLHSPVWPWFQTPRARSLTRLPAGWENWAPSRSLSEPISQVCWEAQTCHKQQNAELTCSGLNRYLPQNSCPFRASECDHIWNKDLCRCSSGKDGDEIFLAGWGGWLNPMSVFLNRCRRGEGA